jgi:hypothetical protein
VVDVVELVEEVVDAQGLPPKAEAKIRRCWLLPGGPIRSTKSTCQRQGGSHTCQGARAVQSKRVCGLSPTLGTAQLRRR